jgi:heme exporter protein CcmD
MTNAATEGFYVLAAYIAAAIIVSAITLATLLDARRQRRQLTEIEARGLRRRSDIGATKTKS